MELDNNFFDRCDLGPFGPPSDAGVYAVCVKNGYGKLFPERIVYIGSSKNIKKRVLNNRHPYMQCFHRFEDKVVYTRSFVTEDYLNIELALIKIYKPLLNKNYKK